MSQSSSKPLSKQAAASGLGYAATLCNEALQALSKLEAKLADLERGGVPRPEVHLPGWAEPRPIAASSAVDYLRRARLQLDGRALELQDEITREVHEQQRQGGVA